MLRVRTIEKRNEAKQRKRRREREGEVTNEGIENRCFLWERCVDIPFPPCRGV